VRGKVSERDRKRVFMAKELEKVGQVDAEE
jgi:hypothetical protein